MAKERNRRMRDTAISRAIALALLLLAGTMAPPALHLDAAWAQDNDDDDDDDDDGPRTTRDRGRTATPQRTRPAAPVRAAVPVPAFAPGEIVTLALADDDLALLLARGYAVLEERAVPEVGIVARRLAVPPGTTLDAARDEVRALATGTDADFNHFYRSEQAADGPACDGPQCPAFALIGWEPGASTPGACGAEVRIGVIDTGINPDHQTFAEARLAVHRIAPEALDPSRAIHGTGGVGGLGGRPPNRAPRADPRPGPRPRAPAPPRGARAPPPRARAAPPRGGPRPRRARTRRGGPPATARPGRARSPTSRARARACGSRPPR